MVLDIQLDKKHKLTSDPNNIIIQREGRNLTFHSTIEGALISFIAMKTRLSSCKTMDELISFQKGLVEALNKSQHKFKVEVYK